jgi:hypothetical protein
LLLKNDVYLFEIDTHQKWIRELEEKINGTKDRRKITLYGEKIKVYSVFIKSEQKQLYFIGNLPFHLI